MTARNGHSPSNQKKPLSDSKFKSKSVKPARDLKKMVKKQNMKTSEVFGEFRKLLEADMYDFPIAEKAKNQHHFHPIDPINWGTEDVTSWVREIANQHSFNVDFSLFVMNGKGLCYMTLDGFRYRSPEGGAFLHADLKKKILALHLASTIH